MLLAVLRQGRKMIHKYKMHGKYIVLDVNSGAVHELDKLAYELLDHFGEEEGKIIDNFSGKYGREKTAETLSELKELKDKGLLFSEDRYEDYLTELSAATAEKPVIKALCLHIAHDCNLRCRYCFASTGDFGTRRALMSAETGKKAIDFVIEKSGSRRNIEIDFFGGEPLLNFAVVEQIVDYALKRGGETGKNFRFTITTNATLLKEEYKEFINKYMGNVVLSIDGRPEVNDGMRVRADGRGTYDEILPKIKDMADSRNQENYYVRGTYTRKNTDFSEDVLHLADLGFRQISVEPVVAAKGTGFDLRREDLPKLFEEYEKLALEYVNRHKSGKGFNFFHFMLDLDHGPCPVKRMKGCGSGDEYLAVTPEGDLYPCHQFVGIKEFKMGNVNKSTDIDMKIRGMFAGQTIYTKPECKKCWAKFFCSGGCTANAWQFNKRLDKPYDIGCELEKKRLECAIWAKVAESDGAGTLASDESGGTEGSGGSSKSGGTAGTGKITRSDAFDNC